MVAVYSVGGSGHFVMGNDTLGSRYNSILGIGIVVRGGSRWEQDIYRRCFIWSCPVGDVL